PAEDVVVVHPQHRPPVGPSAHRHPGTIHRASTSADALSARACAPVRGLIAPRTAARASDRARAHDDAEPGRCRAPISPQDLAAGGLMSAPQHPLRPVARRATAVPAAVLVTVLVCAGCARGISADDTGPDVDFGASPSPGGTLGVMGFGTGDEIGQVRHERATEALGVDVKLSEGELDPQAFLSAAAAGNPPDLVYAERDQIGTFASRGAIMPLSECVDAQGVDTDAFVDTAVDEVTFGGELYGVPEFNAVQITMANADLLDEAGLGLADVDGSDPEAVLAATEALTRSDGGTLAVIGVDSKLPEV